MHVRLRLALCALSSVLAAAPSTGAAEPSGPVDTPPRLRLVYGAPAECPGIDAFRAEVRARVAGEWEARPEQPARQLEVRIAARGGRFVASLDLAEASGEHVSRSVSGAICKDVVNAVALMTALAIQSQPPAEAEAEPRPAASRDELVPAPPAAGVAIPDARAARAIAVGTASAGPRVRVGARAAVESGVAPALAFGPALTAVVELSRARLGIGGALATSGEVSAGGVRARFDLLSLRLEACPTHLAFGRWASLEPCGFAEVGALRGEALLSPPAVVRATRGVTPWLAPGLTGRLLFEAGPLVATLEAMGRLPLRRERFYVQAAGDRRVIFEVPPASAGAALGLAVRF